VENYQVGDCPPKAFGVGQRSKSFNGRSGDLVDSGLVQFSHCGPAAVSNGSELVGWGRDPLALEFMDGADEPCAGGPTHDFFDRDASWSHSTATSVDPLAHLLDDLTNYVVGRRPLGRGHDIEPPGRNTRATSRNNRAGSATECTTQTDTAWATLVVATGISKASA
jgi:hypothetical protein